MTGITGSKLLVDGTIEESVGNIRTVSGKPVAVGFGVSNAGEARAVARHADGVIIGSAIVKKLHESPEGLEAFIRDLRNAI
jgi:tryptophan synthase alpha chain